jgi:hypothetical protein
MIGTRGENSNILSVMLVLSSIPVNDEELGLHVEVVNGPLLVPVVSDLLNRHVDIAPPNDLKGLR